MKITLVSGGTMTTPAPTFLEVLPVFAGLALGLLGIAYLTWLCARWILR